MMVFPLASLQTKLKKGSLKQTQPHSIFSTRGQGQLLSAQQERLDAQALAFGFGSLDMGPQDLRSQKELNITLESATAGGFRVSVKKNCFRKDISNSIWALSWVLIESPRRVHLTQRHGHASFSLGHPRTNQFGARGQASHWSVY